MPGYVLALDQGTTSSRAIVFDRQGRNVAQAQREFPQILPFPGHVEHDPEAIWESQSRVAREALDRAKLTHADVAAIGVTNQRETTILWDRATGKPLANAIVWQSRITAEICERLRREGLAPLFHGKTGLVMDAYFSGTKITYLLDSIPGARERAAKGEVLFGTVDTFLIWRLSGGKTHVTDVSNASRTLIFDIRKLDWDDELLSILDIPRAMLPEVRDSSGVMGETDSKWFGGPIPIAGAAGDQQAATFGQACFEPGAVKNTYGTGCFMLMNVGQRAPESSQGLLSTVGWKIGQETTYLLEGSVFVGGAVVQWLRDGLGLIETSGEIESLAATVEDNGGVVFVPAFVGLGAPRWDPYARGTILGLTRGTTAGHVALAALESMAHQSGDVLEAMRKDAGIELTELKVDGGASVNDRLMQFQADLLDIRVRRPVIAETTALGAAYLAGLAVGVWSNRDEIRKNWALDREFLPAMSAEKRKTHRDRWRRGVDRATNWVEPDSV